jgi:hypothetical protein
MYFSKDVTLLIKTFERIECLRSLLSSIRSTGYDCCPILIADDSREPYREAILAEFGDMVNEYMILPFDSGLSKGRNKLVDRVRTPYFVLNDDDFIYDDRTNLHWAYHQLKNTNFELLGGPVYEPYAVEWPNISLRQPRKFAGSLLRSLRRLMERVGGKREVAVETFGAIETHDQIVNIQFLSHEQTVTPCDFTLNFFMADTSAVRQKVGGWDPDLKVAEHWEFFYRGKQNELTVGFTTQFGCRHVPLPMSITFEEPRHTYFRQLGLRKHGFHTLILPDGHVAMNPEMMREYLPDANVRLPLRRSPRLSSSASGLD